MKDSKVNKEFHEPVYIRACSSWGGSVINIAHTGLPPVEQNMFPYVFIELPRGTLEYACTVAIHPGHDAVISPMFKPILIEGSLLSPDVPSPGFRCQQYWEWLNEYGHSREANCSVWIFPRCFRSRCVNSCETTHLVKNRVSHRCVTK